MQNETLNSIMTRYSCRSFSDKIPSDEALTAIATAGLASPSGMNRQHWHLIAVKNKALIDEMEQAGMDVLANLPDKSAYERIKSRGGKLFYNTQSMIIVSIKEAAQRGSELLDCGIVTENIAIAAKSLGIESLICGLAAFAFTGDKGAYFKERLGFPEGYELGIAILLGYAKESGGKPHEPDLSKLSFVK